MRLPVLASILLLATACGGEGQHDAGATCTEMPGDQFCAGYEACCNSFGGDCYYLSGGTRYDCDDADCQRAAEQMVDEQCDFSTAS